MGSLHRERLRGVLASRNRGLSQPRLLGEKPLSLAGVRGEKIMRRIGRPLDGGVARVGAEAKWCISELGASRPQRKSLACHADEVSWQRLRRERQGSMEATTQTEPIEPRDAKSYRTRVTVISLLEDKHGCQSTVVAIRQLRTWHEAEEYQRGLNCVLRPGG